MLRAIVNVVSLIGVIILLRHFCMKSKLMFKTTNRTRTITSAPILTLSVFKPYSCVTYDTYVSIVFAFNHNNVNSYLLI